MKKIGLLMALAITLVACKPQTNINHADAPMIRESSIVKLACDRRVGSGFQTNNSQMFSADHVTIDAKCSVVRKSLRNNLYISTRVTNHSAELDFSELRVLGRTNVNHLEFTCDPMVEGETYWMAGYPAGGNLKVEPVRATGKFTHGQPKDNPGLTIPYLRIVEGNAIPGMSGGPVLNKDGQVIAIINAYATDNSNLSMVRELRMTWLCGNDANA